MTGPRQSLFGGTEPIRPETVAALDRLAPFLRDALGLADQPMRAEKFKGGQSNSAYKLMFGEQGFVLKVSGSGKPDRAIAEEHQMLTLLHERAIPVPRPRLLCLDTSWLGRPFNVVELVNGRIFWDADLPGMSAGDRTAVYDSMNANLARLHAMGPVELPTIDSTGQKSPHDVIEHAWALFQESELVSIPDMNRLHDLLTSRLPPSAPLRLVHGDFGLWNLVIDPVEPKVLAILDWESAGLGDPLVDLAYHLMPWHVPPDPLRASISSLVGRDLERLGIPDVGTYVELYSGRSRIGFADGAFYIALSFFRWAAIIQWLLKRQESQRNDNSRMLHTQERVLVLAARALEILTVKSRAPQSISPNTPRR